MTLRGRRGLPVVVTALVLSALIGLPALAVTLVNRTFEEETWDSDLSQRAEAEAELGLIDLRSLDLTRTSRTGNGFVGKGLAIEIPPGGFRGFGPFDRLEPAVDEAWYRYHIRLTSWNAGSTGKLPGLAGIYSSSARGCIKPSPSRPGWSARGMFGVPGTNGAAPGQVPIGTYLYHVDQAGDCGDGLWWGVGLERGRWHCVEGRVRMNTPGHNDGVLEGWLDGEKHLRRNDIQFRRAGESKIGVRHMWHNVYFGGSWPTPNRLSLQYDEVVVSTSGRVGCMSPFTDIANSTHRESIVELHALGLLRGCDYRKACPERLLNRGEAAAFISRTLGLPRASRDYFSDDTGTFQDVINRIAEAGITVGCGDPAARTFCPDRTMTRAEFAAMLVRALGLRGDAPDAFADDDGHWAEGAIDLFAAAGLTSGCTSDRFCPNRTLRREEAAAFFDRTLRLLRPLDLATVDPPPTWPPVGEPEPIPVEERD